MLCGQFSSLLEDATCSLALHAALFSGFQEKAGWGNRLIEAWTLERSIKVLAGKVDFPLTSNNKIDHA